MFKKTLATVLALSTLLLNPISALAESSTYDLTFSFNFEQVDKTGFLQLANTLTNVPAKYQTGDELIAKELINKWLPAITDFSFFMDITETDANAIIFVIEFQETDQAEEFSNYIASIVPFTETNLESTNNESLKVYTFDGEYLGINKSKTKFAVGISKNENISSSLEEVLSTSSSKNFFELDLNNSAFNSFNNELFSEAGITENLFTDFTHTKSTTNKIAKNEYEELSIMDLSTKGLANQSKFAFKPELPKLLNGTDTILYLGYKDLYNQLTRIFDLTAIDNDIITLFEGLSPLLEGETALHLRLSNDKELSVPYFSLISSLDNPEAESVQSAANLFNEFFENFITELEIPEINIEQVSGNLNQIKFALPTSDEMPKSLLNLYQSLNENPFVYGVLGKHFIFSNDPTVSEQLSGETPEDENVESIFTSHNLNIEENTTSLNYLTFNKLAPVLKNNTAELLSTEEENSEETLMVLDKIYNLATFEVISKTELKEKQIISKSKMTLDIGALLGLINYFIEAYQSSFDEYNIELENYVTDATYFKDLEANSWYFKHVMNLADFGIVDSSKENFNPDSNISRAEFVTLLLRLLGEDITTGIEQKGSDTFKDVAVDAWYNNNIGKAYNLGLIKGDEANKTFRPEDHLNRAEAVKMLANAFPEFLEISKDHAINFSDVDANSWYKSELQALNYLKIVKGKTSTTFGSNEKLTRAQAAVMMSRLLIYLNQREEVNIWSSLN